MNEVKWIKLKVGMFDGSSFKKIKRAKIDGVADFRDKLTAVWFELLDLGAKINNSGLFINDEIAYRSFEDIAIMLDRTEKEIELCMNWFVKENMIVIINDIYSINNWLKYQNEDGLEKIREQNRIRQQNFRDRQKTLTLDVGEINNVTDNVSVTLRNAKPLIDNNTLISHSHSLNSLKDNKDNNINNSGNKGGKINPLKETHYDNETIQNLFIEYLDLRKKNKLSLSATVITRLKNKLEPHNDKLKQEMLENAIMGNWKDLYPVNNYNNKNDNKVRQGETNKMTDDYWAHTEI